MYILHSFEKEDWSLFREAKAMCPNLDEKVQSMWAVINLNYCKNNDEYFQKSMYSTVHIPHYIWNYENALCLKDEQRKYSFIVLVNQEEKLMIGRYGSFEPEYEEEKIYYLDTKHPWLSLNQVTAIDATLGNILTALLY
jgi:hypothetical protein